MNRAARIARGAGTRAPRAVTSAAVRETTVAGTGCRVGRPTGITVRRAVIAGPAVNVVVRGTLAVP